jgi:hypothetical protein
MSRSNKLFKSFKSKLARFQIKKGKASGPSAVAQWYDVQLAILKSGVRVPERVKMTYKSKKTYLIISGANVIKFLRP